MSSDSGVCDNQTVSYSHRVYDADNYDWCIVPDTGYDVILLAGIAVIVACICQGRLSNLMVLVAGGALQGILFPWNLGRLGNSVSLWLNIEPYELFFYVFLPPLLLDAAVKLDFFLFKKVAVHCIALAFLVVAGSCALLIPVMLYIFQLHTHGWQWPHAALFGSMLASTDAVAIVATMKTAGGPHHLQVVLEGESLLNDATSITLFLVFLKEVQDLQSQTNPPKVGAHEFGVIVGNIIWLSVGGMLIGLAFGVTVRWLLSWMRQRDAGRDQQICLTLAVAHLSFYVANSPANVSGVIAVVTYGLYGAYTTYWDMDVHILESGAFDSFYESLAFLVNGIVFFYSGVSCVNFVVRSTEDLYLNSPISEAAAALWRLPLIYIVFNCIRFIVIFALRPLFKLLHRDLSTKEIVFASIAGLRGSVSLIMAQAFVTESSTTTADARMIKAELVLWVAGFVLLSLIINAPMLPWIMRITSLNTVPEGKLRMRRKAVIALAAHKQEGLQQLKDDPDEMLRGVDWSLVSEHVSMDNAYEQFLDPENFQSQQQSWMQKLKGWVWSQKTLKEDRSAPQTPGTLTPHSHRGAPGQGYDPNAYWSRASNTVQAGMDTFAGAIKGLFGPNQACSDPGLLAVSVVADGSASPRKDAEVEVPTGPQGKSLGTSSLRQKSKKAGSTFGQHGPSSHHGSEADDLAVADMRVRLLAGLKRYLHGKRLNGLLSSEGLRVLDNACETAAEHAAEHPEEPLDVWRLVERDCRGSWGVKLLARAVYQLHRLHQKLRRAVGPHPRLLWPLSRCIALGSQQLSKRLLLACEVAMELMLSLTYAHQVQWLQRHRPSHQLLTEVHEQSQKAWAFIIAREVEAPQRFQAIQSHRAAQAILHQQTQYVSHLLETAVVAEDDGRHLLRPIQQRERQLVDMGPTWRTPSVAGVLRNLPFMRHSPPQVLEVLLQHGRLKMGHKQQPLRSKGEAGGAFVVISGIVRVACESGDGVAFEDAFLGAGATFGLFTALTGVKLPGQATAVAEGNALGKGALVYHLFPSALQTIQARASGDVTGFKHVQLELYRSAAQDLLARLAPDLIAQLLAIFRAHARLPALPPQLPTILSMGPSVDLMVEGTSAPGVTVGQETPRSLASVRAQAGHMQQQIRQDARHGHLVVLQPQQTVQQTSHVLVMQGSVSLEGCAVNSQLAPGKASSMEYVSPTVLPWVPAARHLAGSIVLTACLQGAVVLVTPERPVQAI
ncbi:hypothetical protein WJX79_007439 [Trebouxia sp. C0005]